MLTLTDGSVPNLLINGGFEENTPDGVDPVCWTIRNAAQLLPTVVLTAADSCAKKLEAATPGRDQSNYWTRIVQPQRYPGYRSFIRSVINNALIPVTMFYPLFDGRTSASVVRGIPPQPVNFDHFNNLANAAPLFDQPRADLTTPKNFAAIDVEDRDITLSLSYLVENGAGLIELFFEVEDVSTGLTHEFGPNPAAPNDDKTLVASAKPSEGWNRVGKVFRLPRPGINFPDGTVMTADDIIKGFGIRSDRVSESGALIVYISAVALVSGRYDDPEGVPYNGDLSYQFDPRNSMRPTFGGSCPPGYRLLSDLEDTDILGRLPILGSTNPVPLEVGGVESHTHELTGTAGTLTKKVKEGAADISAARPGDHIEQHTVTEALNAPTSRSIQLCIKL